MGEIADDMVKGKCCDICGSYFIKYLNKEKMTFIPFEHGYPATCKDCWNTMTKEERKLHQKALKETI